MLNMLSFLPSMSQFLTVQRVYLAAAMSVVFCFILITNFDINWISGKSMDDKYLHLSNRIGNNSKISALAVDTSVGNPISVEGVEQEKCPVDAIARIRRYKEWLNRELDYSESSCIGKIPEKNQHINTMSKRLYTLRHECRNLRPVKPRFTPSLIFDSQHLLSFCRNAKAGTTTLARYLLELTGNGEKKYISKDELHEKIQYLLPPPTTVKRINMLNVILVRHPFKRLVSCYVNKIVETDYFKSRNTDEFRKSMKFSSMTDYEIYEYLRSKHKELDFDHIAELRCNPSVSKPTSQPGRVMDGVPSFRSFVLAVMDIFLSCSDDFECRQDMDVHLETQFSRCLPCVMKYDVIMNIESLEQDILHLENALNLPPAWESLQKLDDPSHKNVLSLHNITSHNHSARNIKGNPVLFNRSKQLKAYAQYMNELEPLELGLLHKIFYRDFKLFDYDPCDGL